MEERHKSSESEAEEEKEEEEEEEEEEDDEEKDPSEREEEGRNLTSHSSKGRSRTSIHMSRSDSYVAKIKRNARRYQRKRQRRKTGRVTSDSANRQKPGRSRLASGSESEQPMNGVRRSSSAEQPTGRVRTRIGSSSSIYETPAEEYSSEDKPIQSPFSDSSIYRQRLASSASENPIPSASSVEDLTVKASPVPKGRRGRKREQSSSSASGVGAPSPAKKKKKGAAYESDDGRRTKTINGLVNGAGNWEIRPLDLVWAKCRGYPPYPALVREIHVPAKWIPVVSQAQTLHLSYSLPSIYHQVIDPDMPSKGLNINGEKIQPPSDEVLELRDKHPNATYLIRFFDGRRSW